MILWCNDFLIHIYYCLLYLVFKHISEGEGDVLCFITFASSVGACLESRVGSDDVGRQCAEALHLHLCKLCFSSIGAQILFPPMVVSKQIELTLCV